MARITVKGLDDVERLLGKATASRTLRRAMQKATLHVQGKMAKYPAAPAGSRYIRTGTLGRRWTNEVATDGKRGRVGNNTTYGPWVQSGRLQAWMHRGRWQTDEQVAKKEEGRVRDMFEDEIKRALR